jgi:hypothetical protein
MSDVSVQAQEHTQAPAQFIRDSMAEEDTPPVDLKQEAVAESSHSQKNLEFSETANRKTHKQVLDETSDGG